MHDTLRARGAAVRTVAAAAVFAVAALAGGAQASSETQLGDFSVVLLVALALGGVACGAVVVLPLICLSWRALSLELQPRECRMWETAPSSEMRASRQALLEKLKLDKLYPKKVKPRGKDGAGEAASTPTSASSDPAQRRSPALSRYNSAYSPTFQSSGKKGGK